MTNDTFPTDVIEAAIDEHTTVHETVAVGQIRSHLETINESLLAHWPAHEDSIDRGDLRIATETREQIVLDDRTGHGWREELDAAGVDTNTERRIVRAVHRRLAAMPDIDAPIVLQKPPAMQAGEKHLLRSIARRTTETGRVASAVDQLVIETRAWTKSNWADVSGRNPSTLTRTTRGVEDD